MPTSFLIKIYGVQAHCDIIRTILLEAPSTATVDIKQLFLKVEK